MLGLNWTSIRARALPALTVTAHIAAPFIGTFLLIHLSAPALATLGGASLAGQTMLLGREYYQTALSEPLLLLVPLSLHVFSAQIKRLLIFLSPKKSTAKSSTATPSIRPLTHPLTMSAILLVFLLPTHYLTHRVYPTLPQEPIFSVGPAELDFSFVQTGLKSWPVRSMLMYTVLVCAGAVHTTEGVNLLRRTYLSARKAPDTERPAMPASRGLSPRVKRTALALGLCAFPILAGVYALAREPSFMFTDLAERYRAVFELSWVYRI